MSALLYRLGFALRETGQALERVGCRMQGINSFEEELPRLCSLSNYLTSAPKADSAAYIAPTAAVVGDVSVGVQSSVWYNCSIRGDFKPVSIGSGTNLQDGVCVGSSSANASSTEIGDHVTIGHGAMLSGCTVGNNCLIGMGAVLTDGCQVGKESIIAAGAVVERDTVVPSGEVWAGNPAKKLRALKPQELDYLRTLPSRYIELAQGHKQVVNAVYANMDAVSQGVV